MCLHHLHEDIKFDVSSQNAWAYANTFNLKATGFSCIRSKEAFCILLVECKLFWRWYIILEISGFADFAQCPEFLIIRTRYVSETGSVSFLRWVERDTCCVP
jgi:hypothetical protein